MRFKINEKRIEDVESSAKNLSAYTDKLSQRINFNEIMIKEKTEAVKADLYDIQTKSQTRFDKTTKGLMNEIESFKSSNARRIDQSRE